MNHCAYCGEEVSNKDYDYMGNRRIYICSDDQCNQEHSDQCKALRDEAMWDAQEDDYSRYL